VNYDELVGKNESPSPTLSPLYCPSLTEFVETLQGILGHWCHPDETLSIRGCLDYHGRRQESQHHQESIPRKVMATDLQAV
jgi:hypothetical protein